MSQSCPEKSEPLRGSIKMRVYAAFICLVLFVVCAPGVRAQDRGYSQKDRYSERKTAISEADSRAEQEAERLVSLTPERITLLLGQEPGLFLEVKKMLVRKAYAQGRLLEPKDLTDDAVFRLVRDDEEVRSLITREIVD